MWPLVPRGYVKSSPYQFPATTDGAPSFHTHGAQVAPLSRQDGANPTKAHICLLDNKPSSGNWAINVDAVIKPTPSTWVSCSNRFCKLLSLAINAFILSSMRPISLSKARINFSMERIPKGHKWTQSHEPLQDAVFPSSLVPLYLKPCHG